MVSSTAYVSVHNEARSAIVSGTTASLATQVLIAATQIPAGVYPGVDLTDQAHAVDDALFAGMPAPAKLLHEGGVLAGVMLELDSVGILHLADSARRACQGLVRKHDLAEGPGNYVLDLLHH